MSQDKLWKEQEAAAFLGKSVHWMRKDRYTKRLIPFVKLGSDVRYFPDVVASTAKMHMRGGPDALVTTRRPRKVPA